MYVDCRDDLKTRLKTVPRYVIRLPTVSVTLCSPFVKRSSYFVLTTNFTKLKYALNSVAIRTYTFV